MGQAHDLDRVAINTIRTLAMDAVQAANSGHPGAPMGLAPVAYCLWQRFLRYDPDQPIWPNRDRFVLSVGHASMLLYALLHLTGVKAVNPQYETLGEPSVTLDAIKRFRQLDSPCAGHPEYRWTTGVETTTGPLGQGVATSVGMAIAQRWLAAHLQPARLRSVRLRRLRGGRRRLHDGGHLRRGGVAGRAPQALEPVLDLRRQQDHHRRARPSLAFSEDVGRRFEAYGWNVLRVDDANDLDALDRAFRQFRETNDRPTLIIVRSHIGYGSPNKQDTYEAHGSPLGEEEVRLTKQFYGWPEDAKFLVPDEVVAALPRRHRQARP